MMKLRSMGLRAFLGEQEIKETYLARVRAHRAADELLQGFGYYGRRRDGGMGMCAVGCTIHGRDHAAYETELGIPRSVAYLEDRLFEGMPNAAALEWPARFLMAIPVGADLFRVTAQMMLWLLDEGGYDVGQRAPQRGKEAIKRVAALYRRWLGGEDVALRDWRVAAAFADNTAAAYAADYAAGYAADSSWYSTSSYSTAASFASSAAGEAAAASYAVDHAAAAAGIRQHAFKRMADQLVELLAAAPVGEELVRR